MRMYQELPGRAPQALRVEWLLSSAETKRWPVQVALSRARGAFCGLLGGGGRGTGTRLRK